MLEKTHAPYFGMPYHLPECPKGTVPCIISSTTCIFIALQNKALVLQRLNGAWFFTTLLPTSHACCRQSRSSCQLKRWASPQPCPPAGTNSGFRCCPRPPLQTRALGTRVTAWRGNGDPFCSPLLPRAAELITEAVVFRGFLHELLWFGCFAVGFFCLFFKETGICGFLLQGEVHFATVLLPKESSGPVRREVIGQVC